MAWNEPGGNKGQNPWGGNQGGGRRPPNRGGNDLGSLLTRLWQGLESILGGGNGKSSKNSGAGPILVFLAVVGAIVYVGSGIYIIQQPEKAVILRFGKFHETAGAGLLFTAPGVHKVYRVNVEKVNRQSLKATMITMDQNIVDIELDVQYKVADPKSYVLEMNNPMGVLQHATESALRHEVGGSKLDEVIGEGRSTLEIEMTPRLQTYLDEYKSGLLVTKINIQEALPPKPVQADFIDVNKAKEDKTRMINQAEAYANSVVPVARGQAKRILEDAEGYKSEVISLAQGEADKFNKIYEAYQVAPKITAERMYIETMEKVYAANPKVINQSEGTSMMYLPMDQLLKQSQKEAQSSAKDAVTSAVNNYENQAVTPKAKISPRERLRTLYSRGQ